MFLMAKFSYNNAKNTSINYIFFEFNYSHHFYIFYKKDFSSNFKLKIVDKLIKKLKNLIILFKIFL